MKNLKQDTNDVEHLKLVLRNLVESVAEGQKCLQAFADDGKPENYLANHEAENKLMRALLVARECLRSDGLSIESQKYLDRYKDALDDAGSNATQDAINKRMGL